MDSGLPFCGNAGLIFASGILVIDSFPETGTTVLEIRISVCPSVGGDDGFGKDVESTTELRVCDTLGETGTAGAGLTGTDVGAGAVVGATPLEKKLARAATILPPMGLFDPPLLTGGAGRVFVSFDSALSKLSKLESAFSVSGDKVTP